jgi:hypothetical protein
MNQSTVIEKRLDKLEAEIAQIKLTIAEQTTTNQPWWEEIIGSFADDPAFEEAMEIGKKYRQSQHNNFEI